MAPQGLGEREENTDAEPEGLGGSEEVADDVAPQGLEWKEGSADVAPQGPAAFNIAQTLRLFGGKGALSWRLKVWVKKERPLTWRAHGGGGCPVMEVP